MPVFFYIIANLLMSLPAASCPLERGVREMLVRAVSVAAGRKQQVVFIGKI
jgi:hypothetical protein